MRLPTPVRDYKLDLHEFDIWITPSLGEITDTDVFKRELDRVVRIFDALGEATGNFQDEHHCKPDAIAQTFTNLAHGFSVEDRAELFTSLASTLFLVTAKTDNNLKCQFPLYLRDVARWDKYPVVKRKRGQTVESYVPIPRVIKSEDFMGVVAAIPNAANESRMLTQYIRFLLQDDNAVRQFWTIGSSYFALKALGRGYERNLLSPMVIFKVRGSASASGGHKPEELLREQLASWGLVAGVDFNTSDVVISKNDRVELVAESDEKEKTRAFDFVLPFLTPDWTPRWSNRILIQSQFYAGDSGSVSHKNVDQTRTSRTRAAAMFPDLRFIEYVDGAGYFSSLNRDLRSLLNDSSTHSFFQVRSAAIRLRRELQNLGFLVPLEVEHAALRTDGTVTEVANLLRSEGYPASEVERGITRVVKTGVITRVNDRLQVTDARRPLVRQHMLLDIVARQGRAAKINGQETAGWILVPGYGPFYGLEMDELVKHAVEEGGSLRDEFSSSQTLMADIKSLAQRRYLMTG